MLRRRLALLLTLAAGALCGCGGGGSPPAIGAGAAAQLHSQLARVSTLADAGNRQGALGALAAFAEEIDRQRSTGHLSASSYAAFQTGIRRARAEIGEQIHQPQAVTTTQPAQSTPAPATTTPPAPPHPGKAQGGPKGQGKGHGEHGGHGHKGDGGD